jgi:hypothetical protein
MNNRNQSPKRTNMLLVVRLLIRLQSRRKRRNPILIIKSLLLRNHLGPQRSTNLIHATMLPLIESVKAQWIKHKVVAAVHKVHHLGRWGGGDDVDFGGDLPAVRVEGEIVDVVAKGVFEFAADGDKAEDDVCGDCFC